ncbi:DUF4231 domain-containing protein [Sphingomonas sp. AOB5]|uniref:DUF4231 domain-containing protein n=1 Tax=Sphingomonas sp. AOB5 TaxID=3034017 RepID=UPI0023F7325F|nr:DUF4231 domain-containing protein [Sphingomonas sp. AOB5]MDF7777365.1 DUF4231 domain-containing protein [Sphingomonas sp. AOB5]
MMTLPALYDLADAAAGRQQSRYLWLVRSEYLALIAVSVMSVNMVPDVCYIIVYGALLAIALGILIFRSITKPERQWYQARALAESVKTVAWKYAMAATPFQNSDALVHLRKMLRDLLDANAELGRQFTGPSVTGTQVTAGMEDIRKLPENDRLKAYMDQRIDDQRNWYAKKAETNGAWGFWMSIGLGAVYLATFLVFMVRVFHPDWIYAHPDPLILLAASLLGWIQIKRYNELAASYKLTAVEIGVLIAGAQAAVGSTGLSQFIDDAEEAFSREHTQWLARRSVA